MKQKTADECLSSGFFGACLLLFFALGLFLRLYLLPDQILLDDEWHGLVLVARKSFRQVLGLSSLGATSVLSNLYYWLLLHTVGWSELLLRLPQILSGMALFLLFPLLLRRVTDRFTVLVFTFLLAVSPFLIFYSRNSRPYASMLLTGFTALMFLYQWAAGGKKKDGAAFVLLSALGSYFHPSVLAGAFASLGALMLAKTAGWLRPGKDGKGRVLFSFREGLGAGVTLSVLAALFYVPVYLRNPWIHETLQPGPWFSPDALYAAGALLLGIPKSPLVFIFAAWAVLGAWCLGKKNPVLCWIFLPLYPAYAVLLFFTVEAVIQVPLVICRYTLLLFPVTFFLLACAAETVSGQLPENMEAPAVPVSGPKPFPGPALSLALTLGMGISFLLLCVQNPLLRQYTETPNNFLSHSAYQEDYSPRDWENHSYESDVTQGYALKKEEVPDFYFQLAQDPEARAIMEYPMLIGDARNLYYYYQYFHRKRVIIGYVARLNLKKNDYTRYASATHTVDRLLSWIQNPQKLHFRNMIPVMNLEAVRASGAGYLIIHRNLLKEMWPQFNKYKKKRRYIPAHLLKKAYQKVLGDPVYEDSKITVFKIRADALDRAIQTVQARVPVPAA